MSHVVSKSSRHARKEGRQATTVLASSQSVARTTQYNQMVTSATSGLSEDQPCTYELKYCTFL